MNLSSLSVSRYRTWSSCQMRYAYRYEDHLPEDPTVDKLHAGIGSVAHFCFEHAVKERKHPKLFLKQALEAHASKLMKFTNEHAERLNVMLASWDTIEPLTHGDEVYTELPFWITPDLDAQVIAHGMIDIVVRRGAFFHVIDWKTIKPYRQPRDADVKQDMQLCMYAIATSMLFDVPLSNVRTGMFFLENRRLVLTDWITDRAQRCLERIVSAGYSIISTERKRVYPTPSAENCRWCEFKSRCCYCAV